MSNYKWRFAFSRDSEIISKVQLSCLVLEETSGTIWRGLPELYALGQSVEINFSSLHMFIF